MNFSHGSYEARETASCFQGHPLIRLFIQYHQSVIDHAKEAERIMPGRPLAIALDTVGYKFTLNGKIDNGAERA
jgi:pyruvate kinase